MTEIGTRILVVEDEHAIADVLAGYLVHAGFQPEHIADGRLALEAIRRDPPDLVILDLMLPGMDGIALCRAVRAMSSLPIIMVTARVEEIDRLLGLDCGADDYICKPFSPREVVARVRTVLRRAATVGTASVVTVGTGLSAGIPGLPVDIDPLGQRIALDGQRLELTPTEFRVLSLLALEPGRIFSRQNIRELVHQDNEGVSDRVIDSHIKNIRRKITAVRPDAEVIQSVYGVGYRFAV